jgi:hypothetical protein
MTDHDLRIRQQRGKLLRVALIVEDRGLQRRLHLGENPRRDRGGKMAKKQDFHKALPSASHGESAIVDASASRGKEFGSGSANGVPDSRYGSHLLARNWRERG